MMRLFSLVALVALSSLSESALASPVEKVIGLLEKLQAESEQEGLAEAAGYDKFACFCKAKADETTISIHKATERIELKTAQIKKLGGDINELTANVQDNNGKIEVVEKEIAEAKAIREKERQAFMIRHADVQEAVRGSDEAIHMLKASKFVQLKAKLTKVLEHANAHGALRADAKETKGLWSLMELVSSEEDPQAAGFKFSSNEVIETCMGLKKTFIMNENDVLAEESQKQRTYDMAHGARLNSLTALKDMVAKDEEITASKESEREEASEVKEKTTQDRASDESFLEELVHQCEATATKWDQRSRTRANELMALHQALEILKGGVAQNYGANQKLTGFVQKPTTLRGHWEWVPEMASLSFLQKGEDAKGLPQRKAIQFLESEAARLASPNLSQLVLKLKQDHFKKVRDMIKDMVAKLEADAEEEQTQKGWCDDEMEKSTSKRDESIGDIESDTADITSATAEVDQLKTEISQLEVEIAEMYSALNEATAIRAANKDANAKTVTESRAGLNAVRAAINVLKDFYDNALLQKKALYKPPKSNKDGKTVGDLAPKTGFEGEGDFDGNQAASGGIIGLMEVIESDFDRTITQVQDDEAAAETEFTSYKGQSEATITEKKNLAKDKKDDVETTKAALVDHNDDLKDHKALKKESLDELAKLKPACVATGVSYQERVARREQEIESLKNAYTILNEMGFLQK